jgi:hypothetical protein
VKTSRFLLLPAIAAGLVWLACGVPITHIYIGELYDPDADCRYPGTVVDVVPGAPTDGGPVCDAICITDLDGNAWVSGQCPPYPTWFDLNMDVHAVSPVCERAFAAMCRQCAVDPEDGGHLMITCDAGVPKDAAADTANDADDAAKDAGKPEPSDARGDAPADGLREGHSGS